MKVLVFVEQRDSKLKSNAFEAITTGRKLAGSAADVAAVIVGKNIAGLAGELAGFGVDTVYTVDRDEFENYNVIAYASGVEKAIQEFDPKVVLGVASPMGRDLFPRLAARFDGGILIELHRHTYTPGHAFINNAWTGSYNAINTCNELITGGT